MTEREKKKAYNDLCGNKKKSDLLAYYSSLLFAILVGFININRKKKKEELFITELKQTLENENKREIRIIELSRFVYD